MKILIKVKPNAREERVEKISDSEFVLRVKAPALENKANQAAIQLLSKYLGVPKSHITIIAGFKNKHKIVNILE